MINHIINQKGQSLVEALIALGVATLIISAMAVAVISSVSNSDYSKYQNQATHYAQQGVDVLRQASQSDWAKFIKPPPNGYSGIGCLSDPDPDTNQFTPTQLANCDLQSAITKPNVGPNFIRQFNLTKGVDNAACNVACGNSYCGEVNVYWNDGKCPSTGLYCHKVTLDTCIDNTNSTPTL